MPRKQKEPKELILRGANGILYKIPHSVLQAYVVPPEEFEATLKALSEINPLLTAAASSPGGSVGAGSQVVINVFTSPAGPTLTAGEDALGPSALPVRIMSVNTQAPKLFAIPTVEPIRDTKVDTGVKSAATRVGERPRKTGK